MGKFFVALILLVVVGISSGPVEPAFAQPAEEDPAGLADALNDAINAGDVDRAVALFHEDGVYETPSCPAGVCTGRAAIRELLATFIADELQITKLTEFEVTGAEVRGRSSSTSVGLREAGVDRIIVAVIGVVRDGQFDRWTVIPDLNDPTTAALFGPASMPATGNGGLAEQDSAPPTLALIGAALGLLTLGILVPALRRRP